MTANFSSMNDNMCAHTYWTLLHIVIFHVYLMINCTFSDVFGPKNKQFVLAMFTEFMEECIACRSAVRILKNTELILFCLLFQVCKTYFWSIFDQIIVKNHSSMHIVYGQNQKVSLSIFFIWLFIGFQNSLLTSDLNQRFDDGKADWYSYLYFLTQTLK